MTRTRPPRPPKLRPAPATLSGSLPAKQRTVVLLEVLSGACHVSDALQRLGVTATYYYALERRALQAMLQALEPKAAGRRPPVDIREQLRLSQEILRLQALVRATQRAVSLVPAKPKSRTRKVAPRARKVIAQLRLAPPDETTIPREE
jgi:hypothetical protein